MLLLTGAPGAGKSEALTRVHDALGGEGIGSAAIEFDELGRSHPAIDPKRQLAHLRALVQSFRDANQQLLLLATTAEADGDPQTFLEAAGARESLVIHLVATAETLEARIREREPAEWAELEALVASANRLADARFSETDLEIRTDEGPPNEVAEAIMAELRVRLST